MSTPAPTHSQFEGHFRPSGGTGTLYVRKLAPAKRHSVRLQVAILHDLMEYHRYQEAPGRYLIQRMGEGVEVAWMDFTGHGLSAGGRQNLGSFAGILQDLEAFLGEHAFTPGAGPGARRLVIATGLGALAVLRLLQTRDLGERRPDGMALASPLVRPLFKIPQVGVRFLKAWGTHVERIRVPLPVRSQWARGQGLIEMQSSDPLVGSSLPLGPMLEIMDNAEHVRRDSFFPDIPTLIQVGGQDPIADVETTRIFHKGLGRRVSTLLTYPEMRHDIYNDPGADRALEDVYNWINETLFSDRRLPGHYSS